jgi:Protein of unknown function (DUF4239)
MRTLLESLVILAASLALALSGLVLVRRSARVSTLESHNDVAGSVYQTLATVYAILLAFVCVIAWERFDTAGSDELHEASTITSLHELAQAFSRPASSQIDAALLRYTQVVIDDEWDRMARGEESKAAERRISELWQAYRELPDQDRQQVAYSESLHSMTVLEDARAVRLDAATGQIPRVLWIVLIVGAVIAIAFTYLFGVQNFTSQALITGALTLTIAGVLVLTFILDDPFRGDVRIRPDALRQAEQVLVR